MVDAKASLRKIEIAQKSYKANNGHYATLSQLSSEGLVTIELRRGTGDGYSYEVRVHPTSYEALAIPEPSVNTNLPAYLLDEGGVIHQSDLGESEVTVNDPPAPEH